MDKLTRRTFFGWLAGAVSAVAAGVVVLKKPEPWEDINATVKGVEYDQFGIPKTTPERIEQYKQIAADKMNWEVPKTVTWKVEMFGGKSGYMGSHTYEGPAPDPRLDRKA